MTMKKATGLATIVLAMLALTRLDAAAQAPTLNVTVNGARVTATWTAVPGATGYVLEAGVSPGTTGLSYPVPASTLSGAIDAPVGTYYLRVRGTAGGQVGPASNEVAFSVGGSTPGTNPVPGPGTCGQPATPVLSATAAGTLVQLAWTGVPGALGYRLQVGNSPGAVLASWDIGAATTSVAQSINLTGTFYARVITADACGGIAVSPEVSFTIGSTPSGETPAPSPNPSGPRTPDPAPGTRLPLPPYGFAIVQEVAAQYPSQFRNSCGNHEFLYRLVQRLRQIDSRWGLNWKRGNVGSMSEDVVNYHYGAGPDEGSTEVYIVDTIGGHCGSRPYPNWQDQTDATRRARTIGRWTLQPLVNAGFATDQR